MLSIRLSLTKSKQNSPTHASPKSATSVGTKD